MKRGGRTYEATEGEVARVRRAAMIADLRRCGATVVIYTKWPIRAMGLANASAVLSAALSPERWACTLGVAGVVVAASAFAFKRSTTRVVRHGEGGPIRIAVLVELRSGLVHREGGVAQLPPSARGLVRPAVELRPLRRADEARPREGVSGSSASSSYKSAGGEHE